MTKPKFWVVLDVGDPTWGSLIVIAPDVEGAISEGYTEWYGHNEEEDEEARAWLRAFEIPSQISDEFPKKLLSGNKHA